MLNSLSYYILSSSNIINQLEHDTDQEICDYLDIKNLNNIASILSHQGLSIVEYLLKTRKIEQLTANILFYNFYINDNKNSIITDNILKSYHWKHYWINMDIPAEYFTNNDTKLSIYQQLFHYQENLLTHKKPSLFIV